MHDSRFPQSHRLRKRHEFLRVQRHGRRTVRPRFIVITMPGGHADSRIGITVSRRVGKAVVRNRVKRLVRSFFRQYMPPGAPVHDIVVIARAAAAHATWAHVTRELSTALPLDTQRDRHRN